MKKNIIKLLLAITITLTAFATISTKIEDEDVVEEIQLTSECETETIEEETAEQLKVEEKTLKVYTTTETTEEVIEQLKLLPDEISKKLAGWTIYANNERLYEIADENGEYNGTPIEWLGGITFKQSKVIFLNEEYLNVNVDDEIVNDSSIKIYKLENISDGEIYQIEVKKIEGNGFLKLNILEGAVIDKGELKSELLEIDTNILIENDKDFNEKIIDKTY